jgi:hypothetical protein
MGVPLVADRRGHDHLTSEPFVLHGLELGWTPPLRELSMRMLEVQRERFKRTKQVTMVSEDAIPPPAVLLLLLQREPAGEGRSW